MARHQVSWNGYLLTGNVLASTQTKEGLNLMLISGDVSYFCADVIVNTVPKDLQLGRGSLSQALLRKAGPMLQKELNATRQETEEKVGSIFMTSGCNLDCKAVVHVVAPGWDNGAGSSSQIMANIIKKCLTTVEQQSFSSITFPMIGTGNLGFPKAVFADLMFSEVLKYSSSVWLKTLQKVHFLVHLDDDESHQAFLDKFTRWSSGNPNEDKILMATDFQGLFRTVTNPKCTTYQMKIGAITFQVALGDITKESTDVIVNSTARMFNLKSGVSKAILEGAGPAVEDECAVLATQPHRDFIVTQGGYLKCKIIIHVLGENDIRKTVSSVLEECEQRKHTSVSLPAIGTGNAGKNPVKVADDIISATEDFTWKHSTPSLKKVKVVIFVSELLNVFCDAMKKRQITPSPTFQPLFSKADNIPDYWTDMNQPPTCVIQLEPGQSEYNTVKDKFSQTCLCYTIEKIERIQNAFLWDSYQIRKKHMDVKNDRADNERILFHGTDANSVPYVNHHGFNRSYAGKNDTAYGKGTYFAVDASYSANDIYSRPDSNGRKHVYVARVLTGVYTLGRRGLITPPAKNPFNSTDLFDSVADNIQHPTLFVVFSDNQAYPEYLITFRC
ncbi:poly(ADP-ribose) polymerase family member 15 [Rhinolophus ferrumequinum]|uniref:Poly [ADP-ribose] polymerase n=2 Tax=Rhinolophus ferrumequinum TaxID=59479 RepID=A0A671E1B3_RHIFE|nr:protein mono-ADP-ribosyltransferase PARP15 isoform X1 [Rhinolophus ferrumequinum]XP_032987595.1 protein mono-ADP-ribosyltransferase PARP15 isoform X2 [Rhinolophus ferrumequinum]KAF6385254.1 poly(ADP-ribose) polymerase family member 15 [Rhinolophus ferrumequinum]